MMRRGPTQLSLRRQLLVWLLLPQLVLWLGAGLLAHAVTLRYANRVIDQSLAQSSRALARQVKPFGNGFYVDFPQAAREILQEDPNDRLYYRVSSPPQAFLLGEPAMPPPPPGTPAAPGESHFYTAVLKGVEVRIAALYLQAGTPEAPQLMLVQVAKSRTQSSALAREVLLDIGAPLLLLMCLTSLLVWAGISRGLSPLRRLRRMVEHRSARDISPLEIRDAPSEVRSLAAAINDLLGEMNARVARQRRFIADAAHQLRTPLAGLKSQSELVASALAEPVPDAGRAARQLALLQEGVARAIRLVNQLLALARAEPDAGLEMVPLDLSALARAVTAEAVPRALARHLDLGFDGGETPLRIAGHAGLLRELLGNLLDNALKYTPAGGSVTAGLQVEGPRVWLFVRDDGPGIPDAEHEQVFQRFYRAASAGAVEGCGLGLSIVQEIARRHQATVVLETQQPHGLRVAVGFLLLQAG